MIDLGYALRLGRRVGERVGVSDELRGWNWDIPPVEPPVRGVGLSVSEVSGGFCESMRDVYLRHVMGFRCKPSVKMAEGRVYHEVMRCAVEVFKRIVYSRGIVEGYSLFEESSSRAASEVMGIASQVFSESGLGEPPAGLVERGVKLWRYLCLRMAASVDEARSKHPGIYVDSLVSRAVPQVAEYRIDGTRLGLSPELRVDVFMPTYMVVDYKTGRKREMYKVGLAGYALALESEIEVPVNVGAIVYVWFDEANLPIVRTEYVFVGDEYRREFLERRDEALEIVSHARDPGRPVKCYPYCPYRSICGV